MPTVRSELIKVARPTEEKKDGRYPFQFSVLISELVDMQGDA
jgi:hypothetical protein